MPTLYLLSASPRRLQLLRKAGFDPVVRPQDIPEEFRHDESAEQAAERLAAAKMAACTDSVEPDAVYLAADTIVATDQHILGKPASETEAVAMLSLLSGKTHIVTTGVAIRCGHGETECFHVTTRVTFRELDRETILRYCRLVDVFDKAGAYAIQEHGEMIVDHIEGSLTNVIGLPMEAVTPRLIRCGIIPDLERCGRVGEKTGE